MDGSTSHGTNGPADDSTAALITRATQQVSELIRDEMRLAQTEMAAKGRRLGRAGGLFGVSGVAALLAAQALVAAAAAGLATELSVWASALIVTGVLLVVAAVSAVAGRKQVKRAGSLVPEQAVESIKADLAEIKEEAHR